MQLIWSENGKLSDNNLYATCAYCAQRRYPLGNLWRIQHAPPPASFGGNITIMSYTGSP